ncbi:MAG: GNAT family N-acetyltransferase [Lachnospiraceae bacterium]|nr:GNAT family N-acetyltransferase [Lachnospiraceae bacterium]
MSCVNNNDYIRELYDHAEGCGFDRALFFSAGNTEEFVNTSVDGYRDYPLFVHVFGGEYDGKALGHMMRVDFKSRLDLIAGITSSSKTESVMLIDPPVSKRSGILQYVKVADLGDYALLLKRATYRLEEYERYAFRKRQPYLDEKTWYMYLFATRKDCQHQGYGKKLIELVCSFADAKGYRICLETDTEDNVGLYEHFGFKTVDRSVFKETLKHSVMLYPG